MSTRNLNILIKCKGQYQLTAFIQVILVTQSCKKPIPFIDEKTRCEHTLFFFSKKEKWTVAGNSGAPKPSLNLVQPCTVVFVCRIPRKETCKKYRLKS